MEKKREHTLILSIIAIGVIGLLCLSGCGSNSCEGIKFRNIPDEGVVGISVPGCGGCLSSGKGCNSACWPQSIKLVAGKVENESETDSEMEILPEEEIFYLGCDNRYYGNSCMGCGADEKSCYSGVFFGSMDNFAIFYGSPGEEENICGISNGAVGCFASDSNGRDTITLIENILGID